MILDCLSPHLPSKSIRLLMICLGAGFRALCGVAAGGAKAALSVHFARANNVGDLNAKDSSQETVIGLLGTLVSISSPAQSEMQWQHSSFHLGWISRHRRSHNPNNNVDLPPHLDRHPPINELLSRQISDNAHPKPSTLNTCILYVPQLSTTQPGPNSSSNRKTRIHICS